MQASYGLAIGCRPEIRKSCLWEVNLSLTEDVVLPDTAKAFIEKPRVPDLAPDAPAYYLCMKVRSKLTDNELAFKKVALVLDGQDVLSCVAGVFTVKCKFNQRPRALFHKHSDVMVLCVTLKAVSDDRVLGYDEHDLIFRGGTGSVHSADSRKKNMITEMAKLNPTSGPVVYDLSSPNALLTQILATPITELLSREFLQGLRETFENSAEMNEYKGDMELDILVREQQRSVTAGVGHQMLDDGSSLPLPPDQQIPPQPPHMVATITSAWSANPEDFAPMPYPAPYYPAMTYTDAAFGDYADGLPAAKHRKRKQRPEDYLQGLEVAPIIVATSTSPVTMVPPPQFHQELTSLPNSKRQRTAAEMLAPLGDVGGGVFLDLLFRSFSFMTLEEIRSLCQQSEVPFFVKESQEAFQWANKSLCRFLLNSYDLENHSTSSTLSGSSTSLDNQIQTGEEVAPSFESIAAQKCFLVGYQLTKIVTKLRDGNLVMIGAINSLD